MIGEARVLAVVAARGGSKGLPVKNLADVGGRPLIAWSIDAGRASRYIDRLILSTDDAAIAAAGRRLGCEVPFLRPAELASDDARIEDGLIHALDAVGESFDLLVLLQPTSPLRLGADIDGCIEQCAQGDTPACVSVCEPSNSPYWMVRLDAADRLSALYPDWFDSPRRQELPTVYAQNGAVYVARVPWFRRHRTFFAAETRGYVLPPERSVDVDSQLDLWLAEACLRQRSQETEGLASLQPQEKPHGRVA